MKLYIPEIGDTLVLSKDWTFDLHYEHRNERLISHFNLDKFFDLKREALMEEYREMDEKAKRGEITYPEFHEFHREFYTKRWYGGMSHPVILKAGSMLKVDRIYIRKGQDDYSSVTFYHYDKIDSKKSNGRFWAKLADVNTLEIEDV